MFNQPKSSLSRLRNTKCGWLFFNLNLCNAFQKTYTTRKSTTPHHNFFFDKRKMKIRFSL